MSRASNTYWRKQAEARAQERAHNRRLQAQMAAQQEAALKKIKKAHPMRDLDSVLALSPEEWEFYKNHRNRRGLTVWQAAYVDALVEVSEERRDRYVALVRVVYRRIRKLFNSRSIAGVLAEVARFDWINPVETWKPRGKSVESKYRSLLGHLLLRYPVPNFLYEELSDNNANVRRQRITLMHHIGQGGSMKAAVKKGMLPSTLTKKMQHALLQVRGRITLPWAVREAQITVLGGDRRLVRAVQESFLGQQLGQAEEFWATVLIWLCNQDMLDPAQVGPILDYIRNVRGQEGGEDWTIRGRTVTTIMRGMEEWHTNLARVRKIEGHRYDPSGFVAGRYEFKRKKGMDVWTVTEILTSKDLAREGREMSHCVYSYSWSIQRGRVSIWSVQLNRERVLTVEVVNERNAIVQVRGKANRTATVQERSVLFRWAQENNFTLTSR